MTEIKEYEELLAKSKEVLLLNSIGAIMGWDMEVYMPKGAIGLRSEQLAYMSKLGHSLTTDPHIGELLSIVENHPDFDKLSAVEKKNIYLIRKNYDEATKLPEDLVVEMARQQAITVDKWKEAKEKNDFAMIQPYLEKIVELVKQQAKILAKVKGLDPETELYDALLDMYEPNMKSAKVTEIFTELRDGLVPLVKKCIESPRQPDFSIIKPIAETQQAELSTSLAKFIQYDLEHGRIDTTEHPFTTGYHTDVRITTHYHIDNFLSSVYSVLHEGGHGLYEQNVSRDYMYQPVGSVSSLGLHESQSRFVENMIGRSREFWEYWLPIFKKIVNGYDSVTVDDMLRVATAVRKSKIRIEADEVTYSLHVIIRYEIEQDLMAGKIKVADLPKVWNAKYKEYLDVDIENDAEGVMQDTHWYGGAFGYFPTYALGNIYGAQFLEVMEKDIPNWRDLVKMGDFGPIKSWLNEKIHTHGSMYDAFELVKKVTGNEISAQPFLRYLTEKYSKIYEF